MFENGSSAAARPGPKVAVLGASGFAGALAASLLQQHPWLQLGTITARAEAGMKLSQLYAQHRVDKVLVNPDLEQIAAEHQVAIVGYPHGTASETVKALHDAGLLVLDLSADFRLDDLAVYNKWYGDVHVAPDLWGKAIYGLPELHRQQIATVLEHDRLIALPGCFPTAAILALKPLAQAGLIDDVVIDAKTGVSGAGRKLTYASHYVSVSENVKPYQIGGHRHQPEISQQLRQLGMAEQVKPAFLAHLVPVDQGELVSCYVTPTKQINESELAELFSAAYADEHFVELTDGAPGMRDVLQTNFCRIKTAIDTESGKLLVIATIDNLWKGTAAQAIQCLNICYGRAETEGLV